MKTILTLSQSGPVRSVDIARELRVTKPTVSESLKALETEGYVTRTGARAVGLTDKGMAVAKEIAGRHDSLFGLLTSLGVDEQTASRDACSMEHCISAESCEALLRLAASRKDG